MTTRTLTIVNGKGNGAAPAESQAIFSALIDGSTHAAPTG